jgi:hypothetical protein
VLLVHRVAKHSGIEEDVGITEEGGMQASVIWRTSL